MEKRSETEMLVSLWTPTNVKKCQKVSSTDQHVGRRLRSSPLCGQLMSVSLCAFILGSPPIFQKKLVDYHYKSAEADQHVGGPLRFFPLCRSGHVGQPLRFYSGSPPPLAGSRWTPLGKKRRGPPT